ncbi:MAG TPA: pseudouridine synthase [Aggregatilineales bacterium]|nr:pseudouridine synthase [Aggregatilineales bacterium]
MRLMRFWKPYGVLTQFRDKDGRPTLADYIDVPDVYPAGRLDHDSEGLLLLTDAPRLAARLTDPAYGHPRTYWVQVERVPDDAALHALRDGVLLQGERTRPAQVERLASPLQLPPRELPPKYLKAVPTAWIALTLTEGKNRQVRRMTAAVGHPTLRLVRVASGGVTLDGLSEGAWDWVAQREIDAILRLRQFPR